MNKTQLFKELYNRYGPVTRARNTFLYTKKGIRITDMYLENGRAILGWSAKNAFTHFKNNLEKGITGSFICEDKSRAAKAVSALLNSQRQVYYFANKQDALKAALLFSPSGSTFYKPWSPAPIVWSDVECAIIVPPLPWTDSVYLVAPLTSVIQSNNDIEALVPHQIKLPYPLEAGITRSIYNLIEAIQLRQEKDWFIYDTILTKYWTRQGPYLYPKVPQEQYDSFVLHLLDMGILINPDYNSPSIIPFGADKGVFTKLKNNPFNFQEN